MFQDEQIVGVKKWLGKSHIYRSHSVSSWHVEREATYEEIKKHVAEHNDGMKVSNLYIVQIKRKHGIIVSGWNQTSKSTTDLEVFLPLFSPSPYLISNIKISIIRKYFFLD